MERDRETSSTGILKFIRGKWVGEFLHGEGLIKRTD